MFPWFSFLSYAVVTAVTPGPNNLMSMSAAGRLGLKRSFPFNLGIWAGFSVVMAGCALFCGLVSALIPRVGTPMRLLGGAYLLWLAWQTLRGSAPLDEREGRGDFLSGLLLQFVNPKIYLYGIVSMETYILPCYQGRWGMLLLFALLLAFIGFLFTLVWALFGSAFRLLFSRHAKAVNAVMALLLVFCAVSLFR